MDTPGPKAPSYAIDKWRAENPDWRERLRASRGQRGRPKGGHRLTVDEVEGAIRALAFFDPRQLLRGHGCQWGPSTWTLKEIADLPLEVAQCISSFDVVTENLHPGDKRQETVIRVRWYDKREMLALLAKHFGYVTDKLTVGVEPELRALLDAGRARNAARLAAGTAAAPDAEPVPVDPLPAVLDAPSEAPDAPATSGAPVLAAMWPDALDTYPYNRDIDLDTRPLVMPLAPKTLRRRGRRTLVAMQANKVELEWDKEHPQPAPKKRSRGEADSDSVIKPPVDTDPPPPEI